MRFYTFARTVSAAQRAVQGAPMPAPSRRHRCTLQDMAGERQRKYTRECYAPGSSTRFYYTAPSMVEERDGARGKWCAPGVARVFVRRLAKVRARRGSAGPKGLMLGSAPATQQGR